jgi:hypothetical protein
VTAGETALSYTNKDCEMNEIKVGDWTLTATDKSRLEKLRGDAVWLHHRINHMATECCEILGIDPNADSVAKDIAEEIVLHGTPVDEVVAKLRRHLEGGQ